NAFLEKEKLVAWTYHYRLDDNIKPKKVGIVMAGNIPLVGFHDFLSVFISGHYQHIKLSEKDAILLTHIIEVLIEWDPRVAPRVKIMDMLKDCEAYIATGSNNSSRYFQYYFGKYPSVIRGNKTSVAIINGDETEEELVTLSDDVHLYFGLGCRNVTKIFVPENYDFVPLLNAFKIKYAQFSDHTKFRNNYDYNLALLIMNNKFYMTNGVVIFAENDSLFSPVSQVHYAFYKDKNALLNELKSQENIQCIISRDAVPFGQSQHPELFDYADGVDTMQFLLGL